MKKNRSLGNNDWCGTLNRIKVSDYEIYLDPSSPYLKGRLKKDKPLSEPELDTNKKQKKIGKIRID